MLRTTALAAAFGLAAAASHAAITVNLAGGPFEGPLLTLPNVVGDIDLTVTPTNLGTLGPTVTQNGNGLGAGGRFCLPFLGCDRDGNNQLDTNSLLPEYLTFTFSAPVKLGSVMFSLFDGADDYRIAIDEAEVPGNPFDDNPYLFGWVEAKSFSVGVVLGDNPADFPAFFDSFRVKELKVAAVPVPAAGLLLAGALGGLALARRRKTA